MRHQVPGPHHGHHQTDTRIGEPIGPIVQDVGEERHQQRDNPEQGEEDQHSAGDLHVFDSPLHQLFDDAGLGYDQQHVSGHTHGKRYPQDRKLDLPLQQSHGATSPRPALGPPKCLQGDDASGRAFRARHDWRIQRISDGAPCSNHWEGANGLYYSPTPPRHRPRRVAQNRHGRCTSLATGRGNG